MLVPVLFRTIKSHGLSHYSYFIADGGEAVVIDPRRDVDIYLQLAHEAEVSIRYALETHRNEDYISGATALADAVDCEILHSKNLPFEYGSTVADGDSFGIGRLRFDVLETPGHTRESLSFALIDTDATTLPVMVFTGDALFIGDTGRIDLMDELPEKAATLLYHSLFDKILPLGDGVILCPAHGGGSICGGSISDRSISTLGIERVSNPGLLVSQRDDFVRMKLDEQHLRAPQMRRMEKWNLEGSAPIYPRLPVPKPLSPGSFMEHMTDGALVIDTRMPQAFAGGHIPGSINLWWDGLSSYLGWAADVNARLLLVLPEHANVEETTRRILRLGFDGLEGFLRGGFESWQNEGREVERIATVDTADLVKMIHAGRKPTIIDVRKPGEWQSGSIEGALKIFVGDLAQRLDEVPRDTPLVTMCSVGHRGGLAASILAAAGFRHVVNYLGGYSAWRRLHR